MFVEIQPRLIDRSAETPGAILTERNVEHFLRRGKVDQITAMWACVD